MTIYESLGSRQCLQSSKDNQMPVPAKKEVKYKQILNLCSYSCVINLSTIVHAYYYW